jgi:hypothetical protein
MGGEGGGGKGWLGLGDNIYLNPPPDSEKQDNNAGHNCKENLPIFKLFPCSFSPYVSGGGGVARGGNLKLN